MFAVKLDKYITLKTNSLQYDRRGGVGIQKKVIVSNYMVAFHTVIHVIEDKAGSSSQKQCTINARRN